MCMKARYSYRIYPTDQQRRKLSQVFGCCRVVWNDALGMIRDTPDGEKWPSKSERGKAVTTEAKKTEQRKWLSDVSAVALQQSLRDLDTGLSNFMKWVKGGRKGRRIGFPRFKSKKSNQSCRFVGTSFAIEPTKKLRLAKIGSVKVKWSRELPSIPSSATVTCDSTGKYFVSFVVEVEQINCPPQRESVGVDLGIKVFAFLSGGRGERNSPSYARITKRIKRLQRRLAKQKKGSNRRNRTKLIIAKLHARITSTRKDFQHKLSTELIRENQVVSLENLNVSGMIKNRCLSRAISEQGWFQFRMMLESKGNMYADRKVVIINRFEPTSQVCSKCSYRWGKLDLKIRTIKCVSCGHVHDRDENASENINQVGAGHAHDSKRTWSGCKTPLGATCDETSSQPCGNKSCLAGESSFN